MTYEEMYIGACQYKEKRYCVYKHTAPNGKVYIGASSNPIRRWRNKYKENKAFYDDIVRFGWDNFKHEILYTDLSLQEAGEKETELIAEYNSTNPMYGYNRSKGGKIGDPDHGFKDYKAKLEVLLRHKYIR